MPKVEIDTPGVTIRLEAAEASITELSKQAIELYREASAVDTANRPVQMGFAGQNLDKRWTPAHENHNQRLPFEPVHA